MALVIFFKKSSRELLDFVKDFLFLTFQSCLRAVQGLFSLEGSPHMPLLRGLPKPFVGRFSILGHSFALGIHLSNHELRVSILVHIRVYKQTERSKRRSVFRDE